MACFHHHNHHSPTCFCSNRCNTPPPPAIDPILLQSIVSQLLQNPQTAYLYSAASTAPFDLRPCSSQYPQHRDQKRSKQKQSQPHRQPFEDQFQDQYSVFTSLLQRIDVLESSLHRFSTSATTFSLRHVAARTIQIHFRAHLVRRSRALHELKELASIKSALNVLKSSLFLQKRVDFFSLSHEALDLITRLETIESCDKMVRDSKSSIRREIGRFLELIDEICAKRNIVSLKMVKQIRMARNDDKSRVSNAGIDRAYHRGKSSKQRNVDSDEKRLINDLRERVERIQHISKGLIDEEDSADSDDSNGGNGSGAYHRGKSLKQHNVDSDEKRRIGNLRERVEKVQRSSKSLIDEEDSVDSDDGNGAIDANGSGAYHRGKSSKQRNVESDEKRLINNLRERVERIQKISKGLKDEGDSADYTDQCRRREVTGKHRSPAEKHVWFADDGNATRVYDIHEDGKVPMKRVACKAGRREESVDDQREEDSEVESDLEENDAESAEGSEFVDEVQNGSLEGSSQGSEGEETQRKIFTRENDAKVKPSHLCQDEKLILSAPPPVKMEDRANSATKQNGVKIIG